MLIDFRVANFRSFNEEQTLSLVASKDETHPDHLLHGERLNLLKAAAIYGPNASGKSNLIKALGCMRSFVVHSATKMNQGDRIGWMDPFRFAPDCERRPSTFEVTVLVGQTRFEYGFSATHERVYKEWLTAYPPAPSKRQGWFEREFEPSTDQTRWVFRPPLKSHGRILEEKTRDNGLVLSRGAELNIALLSDLFLWFRNHVRVFDFSEPPYAFRHLTAARIKEDEVLAARVNQLIRHADMDIEGVSIVEVPLSQIPKNVKELLPSSFVRRMSDKEAVGLGVRTTHHPHGSEMPVAFDLQEESNGTQRFFALSGPFLDALTNGTVLAVDELECSMHPLLTRGLVELFQSADANKKGAQLIFATHDNTLMDPELFRRDQIWLLEKNRGGASELYSLYDFDTKDRPRTTTAFQRNYLAGRYGGVPKFGPVFEDLELE